MPTNQNPLVALELDVQNLLSRGTPETISAAENLIRSFVTNAPGAGSAAGIGQLQKALIKKREEQRGKKKVSQIISRRKTAPRPLTAPSLDDPLRRFEQLGPAAPGVTPQPGQPGGPPIFSNIAGMQPPPAPAAPGPKEEFTEEEMVELGQMLPANVFKRLVEGREELVAARRAPDLTVLSPEAEKAKQRQIGTAKGKDASPLAVVAGNRANNFFDLETAKQGRLEQTLLKDPNITFGESRKKSIELSDPEVTAFRGLQSALEVLVELDRVGSQLFKVNDPIGVGLNAAKLKAAAALDQGLAGTFARSNGLLFNLVKGLGSDARISDKDLEFSTDTASLGFVQSKQGFEERMNRLFRIFTNGPRRILGQKEITFDEIAKSRKAKQEKTKQRRRVLQFE